MTRTGVVSGSDDGIDVKVMFHVKTRNLTKDEANRVKSVLTREIAKTLSFLPYSDFGIDNINVG